MRRIAMVALVVTVSRCFAADGVCFRSVGEAATGTGMRDAGGFRVVGLRQDAFSLAKWATVGSCLHPERPAAVVRAPEGADTTLYPAAAVAGGFSVGQHVAVVPVVHAGDRVLVVRHEESLRVELMGVALGSAGIGERVQVRLAAAVEGGAERSVTAQVEADGVLEMEGI